MSCLVKGDRLFLYTDDVIEAPDADDELFNVSRLTDVLEETGGNDSSDVKQTVLAAVRAHTNGSLVHDGVMKGEQISSRQDTEREAYAHRHRSRSRRIPAQRANHRGSEKRRA